MDEPPFILDGNTIIGHDLKAHWQELTAQYPEVQTFGLETDGVGEKQLFDTAIAHYLLHPEMRHGLDYLKDAYRKATLKELKELFEKELHDTGLWDIFRQMEMPLMCVLARMEQTGVRIDEPGLAETSRHFTEEMMHLEEEIYRLAGQKFNIASPRQVGEILFDVLQLDSKAKKTKTGQYVTGEEVLEGLRHKHKVVGKILEHRGLKKLLGTYIDALPKLVNTSTGHIHTTFNQTVTTTGRLSSSNPNLQNIPVRDAMGKEVRKAFIPDEGQLFFSADYSQIELRIMAHLSKDENLVQAFLCGEDIHAATAAKIFHKDITEVTSDERRRAKTANFGIIYGISAFGLAERLGCSRSEAKQLIDGYFQTYPGVKEYMERSIAMAREKGYTETIFHRRCPLPDINSHNAVVRGYAERNAINSPIQGSAADIMKIAMIRVDRRMRREGLRSRQILQEHDELNFSVLPDERRRAKTANFGIIYGISAFGLAERLGCSSSEAKQLIDGYFQTYPGVKEYMERSIAMAREKGYTETIFHRRCPLPDINSHNAVVRGYAERNAINSPIQGSAADIMKIAMIRVDRRMRREGLRSRMILQVHDELNFSVLPEERDKLQRLVIEEMQNAASLTVPLIADAGWGSNWLEAH